MTQLGWVGVKHKGYDSFSVTTPFSSLKLISVDSDEETFIEDTNTIPIVDYTILMRMIK